MKRDIDLIRRIAQELEALEARHSLTGMEGIDGETFAIHVAWLKEAGLLLADITEYWSGEPPDVRAYRLTWAGCEFLDAARNDTTWQKVRKEAITSGRSMTFDVFKDLLKAEVLQGFPTLRAMA